MSTKYNNFKLVLISILILILIFPLVSVKSEMDNYEEPTPSEDGWIGYDAGGGHGFIYERINDRNIIEVGRNFSNPGERQRGYFRYNISSIPDSSTIKRVRWIYDCIVKTDDGEIRDMEFDPSNTVDKSVFGDAGNGTKYFDVAGFPVLAENQEVDLGSTAVTDVQNALVNDWFAIGLKCDGEASGSNRFSFTSVEGGGSNVLEIEYWVAPYNYTFLGLFEEDGDYTSAINLTAYDQDGSYTFEVDHTETVSFDARPILFSFPVNGSIIRRIYAGSDSETIYLFTPETNYSTYSFTIRDYTGILGEQEVYLEARRHVNNTERVIERMRIQDTVNEVPLTLAIGRTYVLQCLFYDLSTYRFGYFVSGVDPTPTLSIRDIAFSRQAQLTYRYVTITTRRSASGTTITTNYADTLDQTTLVSLAIRYRNGTLAYSDTSVTEPVSFVWASAKNTTEYYVVVDVDHQFYGTLTFSELLSGVVSFSEPPSLSALGTWGNLDPNALIPSAIILFVAGAFSVWSVPVGAFLMVITTGFFIYFDWINISATLYSVAFSLAIMIGIAYARWGRR